MARGGMDILTRLADAGEDAIAKLTDAPGADRALGAVTSLRDRLDEVQKRLRGLDELEKRVADLERRLDGVAPAKATGSTRSAAATSKPKAPTKAATKSATKGVAKTAAKSAKRSTTKSSTRPTGSGSPG